MLEFLQGDPQVIDVVSLLLLPLLFYYLTDLLVALFLLELFVVHLVHDNLLQLARQSEYTHKYIVLLLSRFNFSDFVSSASFSAISSGMVELNRFGS